MQITTVHQSKGLQYPVVHLPFASMKYVWPVDVARYHEADGTRMLDVAGAGPSWAAHEQAHLHEEAGEELRDLYVALTRAQSQVVTWWAPTANTPNGGLHRLLFGRQPGQSEVPDSSGGQGRRLRHAGARPARPSSAARRPRSRWSRRQHRRRQPRRPAISRPAPFDREVDTEWRRTSYSGLIRVQEQPAGVTSEPERDDWDPTESEPSGRSETEASLLARGSVPGVPSPMAALPSGAAFGSLVHAVLEETDPEAPDLRAELAAHTREQLAVVAGRGRRRRARRRAAALAAHPARSHRVGSVAWSTSRCATGSASSTSSSP